MKLFTHKATLGGVIFGLMFFGSFATPNLVRAQDPARVPDRYDRGIDGYDF